MRRRDFLASMMAAGAAACLDPVRARARRLLPSGGYLALHPFISAHPEAVFVFRTGITSKTATGEKQQAGADFASAVFLQSDSGLPFTSPLAVKPNLTCTGGLADTVGNMGIRTDTPFMEGVITALIGIGFPAGNIYVREGNWFGDGYCPSDRLVGGMDAVAARTGIHLFDYASGRKVQDLSFDTLADGSEVVWRDCPDGVVFRRIGYAAPFNDPDSWILNVAKFKTHSMGMTLCVKNQQGTVVSPLVRFCEGVDATAQQSAAVRACFQPDMEQRVDALYAAHRDVYARWKRAGRDASGGYGMETWAQRTCDSHLLMRPGFHVIEGLYGRNGNGFEAGPGPGGAAEDFLTNLVICGCNAFLVDVIGIHLAGHEPGNFGLLHIAKSRGLLPAVNPAAVPVYVWNPGGPVLTDLSALARTPLVCPYLRRDFDGQSEPQYHLVDEPYDYAADAPEARPVPEAYALGPNYANPVGASTVIEYALPRGGHTLIDVFNAAGERVDVLVDATMPAGAHMTVWHALRRPAGSYFCRMRVNGFTRMRGMTVLR